MKQAVIVGGGVSGLVCSYIFSHLDVDVKVLEPGTVGGEFLAGGLKYIHKTDLMVELFEALMLPYSNYTIQGGIMLRGEVYPHPKILLALPKDEAECIQADHYRKTRRSEPGDQAKKAMNDPASVKPRRALRCNFVSMIEALAREANIVPSGLQRIKAKDNELLLSDGSTMRYDYLVLTTPLWVTKKLAPFFVPEGMAMGLNVINVKPTRDRFARWDYVYTPYTPADAVHRFSPYSGGYSVEVNGELDREKLISDLNFIFTEGYSIEEIREGLKGHLLPLDQQAAWPENVAPLGRFAKWDSRATTDVTLEDSIELARRWIGDPRPLG